MTFLLGIDVGTSSVKALVFEVETATVHAVHGQEYPISTPTADRAEQLPEDYWNAAVTAVRQVTQDVRQIHAIGLSGQMHGTILLDAAQQPVHPAIIWADGRSAVQVQHILDAVPDYLTITGTRPAAGFMITTLKWITEYEPALLKRTRTVLLPKDYLRLRMTGEIATEKSDAASTGLSDVKRGEWSDTVIDALKLPRAVFPPVLQSHAVAGRLTSAAAEALGLTPGIPVVAGCADQPAQAIGNGLIRPGRASITIGTGGQVLIPLEVQDTLPTHPGIHVFNHAMPEMWYVLGAILSAGLCLRWLRDLTGLKHNPDAYTILSGEAAVVPPGADGLLFQPYLMGERTPHLDPSARGSFTGLRYHHTRGHLARAVMEGVSFALRQALEVSLSLTGDVESVIVSGGGAESDLWRDIQTHVYGLPLRKSLLKEQACIGAALTAGVGTGIYRDFDQACEQVTQLGTPTEPDPQLVDFYSTRYAQFLELYSKLR